MLAWETMTGGVAGRTLPIRSMGYNRYTGARWSLGISIGLAGDWALSTQLNGFTVGAGAPTTFDCESTVVTFQLRNGTE